MVYYKSLRAIPFKMLQGGGKKSLFLSRGGQIALSRVGTENPCFCPRGVKNYFCPGGLKENRKKMPEGGKIVKIDCPRGLK